MTLLGLTYAYFLTRIQGNTNEKSINVTTAETFESSISGNTCNGIDSKEVPNTNSYIIENSIKEKEIQTYKLTVEYKETGVDQSDDMGKELSFKVDIFSNKNTIELTGNVINASKNDYVVINSKEQTSEIVDGKYKFIGIEPDNHKISIKNRA